jgi:hypothetical protein
MEYRASASKSTVQKEKTQPTTVRLPGNLLDQAREFLESGMTGIATMSGLVAGALEWYLEKMRREQIDQAFLKMAEDRNYQRLSRELNEMFSHSDRETMSLRKVSEKAPEARSRQTASASTRHA